MRPHALARVKPGDVLAVICGGELCPLRRLRDRRVVVRVTRDHVMDDRNGCWRRSDGYETGDPGSGGPAYHAARWTKDHNRRWKIKEVRREYESMLDEMSQWISDRGDGPDRVSAAAGDQIRSAYKAAKKARGYL